MNADTTQMILDRLKESGSVMTLPHEVTFWMYFPTRVDAEKAAEVARKEQFEVEVGKSDSSSDWHCSAAKMMVPTHEAVSEHIEHFKEVASKFNGEYDGWDADVDPSEQ